MSDWASVTQMIPHGFCKDKKDAAYKAVLAGVDMEMQSPAYSSSLKALVEEGAIPIELVDESVRNILRIKFQLGLFDNPYTDLSIFPKPANKENLQFARIATRQCIVLLKNKHNLLPLKKEIKNRTE